MGDLRAHIAGDRTLGHYLLSRASRCRVLAFDIDLAKRGTTYGTYDEHDEPIALPGQNLREAWLTPDHPGRQQLTVELRCMADVLARRVRSLFEVPVAVAYSGNKGLHVYAFTGSIDAGEARSMAVEVLDSVDLFEAFRGTNFYRCRRGDQNLEVEVFPKQAHLAGKDLGNLLRLPLGVHRKSGQRSFFLDMRSGYDELREADPVDVLTNGARFS